MQSPIRGPQDHVPNTRTDDAHGVPRYREPIPTQYVGASGGCMDDALQELGRHILASFEAGGRLENPELPAKEWMKNSASYNRAIVRGFEAMLDKHPKPVYVDALQLICAIRARLEQAWLGLV